MRQYHSPDLKSREFMGDEYTTRIGVFEYRFEPEKFQIENCIYMRHITIQLRIERYRMYTIFELEPITGYHP